MIRLFFSPINKKTYLLVPLYTDYTMLPKKYISQHHLHPVYHLVFIHSGCGRLEMNQGFIKLEPGDIILINPMGKHIFHTDDSNLYYYAFNFLLMEIYDKEKVHTAFINQLEEILKCREGILQEFRKFIETAPLEKILKIKVENSYISSDPEFWNGVVNSIKAFYASVQECVSISPFNYTDFNPADYANKCSEFFNKITSEYFIPTHRKNGTGYIDDMIIRKILVYLENNMESALDLKQMAKELGYNPSYLCKHFSTKTGQTLTDFFNRSKINRACKYLRHTDRSITQIALLLGFNSSQHFCRRFKELVGTSPKKYRDNIENI